MALSVSGGNNKGNVETKATHFGGLDKKDQASVLTYTTCPEKGEGRKWLSKLSVTKPANVAAMLAGVYDIKRPNNGLVLIPRNRIKATYSSVDLTSQESLSDPVVLDAIDILKGEGCDVGAIEERIASFATA